MQDILLHQGLVRMEGRGIWARDVPFVSFMEGYTDSQG
jgi:hypothetical protein